MNSKRYWMPAWFDKQYGISVFSVEMEKEELASSCSFYRSELYHLTQGKKIDP